MSNCICNEHGYTPDCPQAFVQNGKVLHVLSDDDKVNTKRFIQRVQSEPIVQSNDNQVHNLTNSPNSRFRMNKSNIQSSPVYQYMESDDDESSCGNPEYERALAAVESSNIMRNTAMKVQHDDKFENDVSLLKDKREVLRKFEPLSIGNQSLTEMSIGGYQIDLSKAAEKAKEIAPLPAAKLPKIFRDAEMNFLHHFFQGFEILIGRDTLVNLAQTNVYSNQGDNLLYQLIEKMIKTGYERTDDEITLFSKKVITSTFELDPCNEHDGNEKRLIVAANLWGFQYIESGMQCREADLKMWLSINYNHFRTIWYNTFKSSGIPAFALEGVQSRYEKPKKREEREIKNDQIPEHIIEKMKEIKLLEARINADKTIIRRQRHDEKPRSSKRSSKYDKAVDNLFGIKK